MSEHDIITEMDAFALELMKQAREQTEVGLADRLATFNSIGKWLSIKHGLEDAEGGSEGTKLHDLKSRLKGDDGEPAPRGRANAGEYYRPLPKGGRNVNAPEPDEPGIGGGLTKLRAKLPPTPIGSTNRGFRRIGRNSGSPPFAPVGGSGSVPVDLSGGADGPTVISGGGADIRSDGVSAADLPLPDEGMKDAG